MPIYVDAEGQVAGRLSTWVAKKALEGQEVIIINSEKALITGSRRDIMRDFSGKYARGEMYRGPFYPRMPDKILRRIIRGMLPYNKARGRVALKRVKTYIGIPPGINPEKCIKIEEAKMREKTKYMSLGEISARLGAVWGNKYLRENVHPDKIEKPDAEKKVRQAKKEKPRSEPEQKEQTEKPKRKGEKRDKEAN